MRLCLNDGCELHLLEGLDGPGHVCPRGLNRNVLVPAEVDAAGAAREELGLQPLVARQGPGPVLGLLLPPASVTSVLASAAPDILVPAARTRTPPPRAAILSIPTPSSKVFEGFVQNMPVTNV